MVCARREEHDARRDHGSRRGCGGRRPKRRERGSVGVCGLVAWALEHPDRYIGWDFETLSAALRWTFDGDADAADEVARRLIGE
jgi:hypothetical protein